MAPRNLTMPKLTCDASPCVGRLVSASRPGMRPLNVLKRTMAMASLRMDSPKMRAYRVGGTLTSGEFSMASTATGSVALISAPKMRHSMGFLPLERDEAVGGEGVQDAAEGQAGDQGAGEGVHGDGAEVLEELLALQRVAGLDHDGGEEEEEEDLRGEDEGGALV